MFSQSTPQKRESFFPPLSKEWSCCCLPVEHTKQSSLPSASVSVLTWNCPSFFACFLKNIFCCFNLKRPRNSKIKPEKKQQPKTKLHRTTKKFVGWLRRLWPWEPIFYNVVIFTSAINYNRFGDLPLTRTAELYFVLFCIFLAGEPFTDFHC